MLRDDIFSHITEKDLQSGAALRDLPNLLKVLDIVRGKGIRRMCDIGCGYGGLTKIVSRYLQVDEVYGIDIDDERLQVASQRGIKVFRVDIEYEKLSFPDEYFDLVTSFGVLEHLKHFDNFFTESYRVLRKGGFLIISMPNLGSWINRIALLLGFQPRDVEVSCRVRNQGFLPIYSGGYIGHVHSATLRAMRKILEFYNFQVVKVQGSSPYMETKRLGVLLKMLDKIFSMSPSLSRHFIIPARKRNH